MIPKSIVIVGTMICLLGIGVEKVGGQPSSSVCATTSSGKQICVRFDNLSADPVPDFDFAFDLTSADNPKVELLTGRDGSNTLQQWRVWCKDTYNSNVPANIGEIKGITGYDFDVKVLNDSDGPGAATVGTTYLVPTGSYSSSISGGTISTLNGNLTVKQDSTTGGNAALDIATVASGKTVFVPGTYQGTIGLLDTDAVASIGSVPEGKVFNLTATGYGAYLTVFDLPGTVNIGTFSGVEARFGHFFSTGRLNVGLVDDYAALTLSDRFLSGDTSGAAVVVDAIGIASVVGISCACLEEVVPCCSNTDRALSVTVSAMGVSSTVTHEGPAYGEYLEVGSMGESAAVYCHHVGGTISLSGGLPDTTELDVYDMGGTGVIDLNDQAVAGELLVEYSFGGGINNGGDVSGDVSIGRTASDPEDPEYFSGEATFANVSGSIDTGPFTSGTLNITGNLTGPVLVHDDGGNENGNLEGAINVTGDIGSTGSVTVPRNLGDPGGSLYVGGDMSGAITVNGNMGSYGSLLVDGKGYGAIEVDGQMASGSQMTVVAGLDSASTISVNSAGSSSTTTNGTIWIGGSTSASPLPTLTMDGSIAINACDGGTFSGLVKIVGCSPTNHRHSNICLNGVNSGTITYVSGGCTYGFVTHCTGPCGS